MKKGIIKGLTLFAIFCAGVLVFGQLTNHANQDLTTERQTRRSQSFLFPCRGRKAGDGVR